MKERVSVYVDGFNLYYGLRSQKWGRKVKWLDVGKLAANLIQPSNQALAETHYFTSRISGPPDRAKRQTIYLEALEAVGSCVSHYGHFLSKQVECSKCGHKYTTAEEKMTDINIAIQMLSDAMDDRYDKAILVSGDSDMAPIVEKVTQPPIGKLVVVAFPPKRESRKLRSIAPYFTIYRGLYFSSQLPKSVTTAAGIILERPRAWK